MSGTHSQESRNLLTKEDLVKLRELSVERSADRTAAKEAECTARMSA